MNQKKIPVVENTGNLKIFQRRNFDCSSSLVLNILVILQYFLIFQSQFRTRNYGSVPTEFRKTENGPGKVPKYEKWAKSPEIKEILEF